MTKHDKVPMRYVYSADYGEVFVSEREFDILKHADLERSIRGGGGYKPLLEMATAIEAACNKFARFKYDRAA